MTTLRASQSLVAALPPAVRLARAAAMNCAADALAIAGLRRLQPQAAPHALGVALALQRLGRAGDQALAALLTQETHVSDTPVDFLAVAVRAATVCVDLGIPYMIGGGVASTVHGEFRTTRDVDLVVRLTRADASRFAQALAANFVLNPPDIAEALARVPLLAIDRRQRATFAAYDRASGYQLDVFCASDSAYDRAQLDRALPISVPEAGAILMIASAEDTILTKLEWYAITPSDRQWDDVQTILRVQGDALDQPYLSQWAAQLGITSLWEAAQRGEQAPHHRENAPPDASDPRQTRMEL